MLEQQTILDCSEYFWVQSRLVRESPAYYTEEPLTSPDRVEKAIKEHLDINNLDKEYFLAIYLNRKNYINAISIISIGTLSSSLVHPREVFKVAILSSSASLILVHNHPSGDTTPSPEDISVTKQMIEAGKILGIQIIDHIIIGEKDSCSMRSRGDLSFT